MPERLVLVIDDEADLRNLLLYRLGEEGLRAASAATASEGLAMAAMLRPSLVILDLMLPDLPGTEVCRRLRADPGLRDVPIMMLTARADEVDRIVGFELGVDDYVVKPFSVRELMLRVRVLLRRAGERAGAPPGDDGAPPLRWRGLELREAQHRVTADGEELALTRLEFRLLQKFLENPARALSRDQLLDGVWHLADVSARTVDTHIRRLREKLGVYGEAIETLRGVGYRLRTP